MLTAVSKFSRLIIVKIDFVQIKEWRTDLKYYFHSIREVNIDLASV
jgi:hypothetical protein